MDDAELHDLCQILWNYNKLGQPAQSCDVLLLGGTNDLGVARHAAALARQHHYPIIIVSGGVRHEHSKWGEPINATEAEAFARILIEHGISPDKILIENNARNTGENITLSKALLKNHWGQSPLTGQLVHQPYMERRFLATAQKQWPEVSWQVSSQTISYEQYRSGMDAKRLINSITGDTRRIIDYVTAGFQTEQHMPEETRTALKTLLAAGYGTA